MNCTDLIKAVQEFDGSATPDRPDDFTLLGESNVAVCFEKLIKVSTVIPKIIRNNDRVQSINEKIKQLEDERRYLEEN